MADLVDTLVAGRRHRNLSQLDIAMALDLPVSAIDRAEQGDDHLTLYVAIPYARVLGYRMVLTFDDGEPDDVDLFRSGGWVASKPTDVCTTSNLEAVLDELAAIAHRRRRAAPTVISVDFRYREQAAHLVWGRRPGPDDRWADLPTWEGVPVNLVPHLGDAAELTRRDSSPRRDEILGSAYLAPAGFGAAEADCYATFRRDGSGPDEAADLTRALHPGPARR